MSMKNKDTKGRRETYGFTKVNLYVLLGSILLLVVGYLLMSGGSSPDGVTFNPDVFSARRIRIAPIVCVLGYAGVVVAILWRRKSDYKGDEEPSDHTTEDQSR